MGEGTSPGLQWTWIFLNSESENSGYESSGEQTHQNKTWNKKLEGMLMFKNRKH